MKQKHKDAMIAMGIKIAGLERINRDHCVQVSDNTQEITNIKRTLKNHGEAHMAQDLLPQFTLLVKKVEKHDENFKFEGRAQQDQNRRLTDHDESIEALSETVDQLSTCKCEAGNQMLKRIAELEESNAAFLKSIPDIEILKTQTQGVIRDVDTLKIQQGNTSPRLKALMDEVIKQKAFLAKVEALIEKQVKSRYMVMDKEIDMKVKPGRVKR